ncbi:MAG: RNA polymerase sigma factor [Polyangiaceae bacterium]|nr:RNA polymerase sigma factor [Polyangiaceae bacterium]
MSSSYLKLVQPVRQEILDDPRDFDAQRLLQGLRAGSAWAERELLERFTRRVQTVLVRILGTNDAVEDMTQVVFARALDRIGAVHDPEGLDAWLTQFAVNVAREEIRTRKRKRWLLFFAPQSLPDGESAEFSVDEDIDTVRAVESVYELLDEMSADHRIAFALRNIECLPLPAIARVCRVSLATIKRRLSHAEDTFSARARNHPVLREWMEGERWS